MAKKRIDEIKEDRKAKRQRGYIMQNEDYLEEISDTLAIMCDHMNIIVAKRRFGEDESN